MPYVCVPSFRVAPTGLPIPPHHHRVGHGVRRVLRRWGVPAGAWHCVWVVPAVATVGGAAWGVAAVLRAPAVVGGGVVVVTEPGSLALLGVALVGLWGVRR